MWFCSRSASRSTRALRAISRRARRPKDRRQATRRLFLEGLEERQLLAFGVLAEYATAYPTSEVELARIDADSRLDMVLIENQRVTIRPGNADGTFGNPLGSTGEIRALKVVTGDFNNDGKTDLVTFHNNQLSLRIGNGNGTFQTPRDFRLPPQLETGAISPVKVFEQDVTSIATGDLNDDGKMDLVVGGTTTWPDGIGCGYYSCSYSYSYSGYVNVLLGTGTGEFDYVDADPSNANWRNAHPLGNWQSATAMAIVDVNHDGRSDVVVAKYRDGLATLLGQGTGSLQNAIHSGSGNGSSSISLGDLDGDGNLDTVSRSGNNVIVQKGQGNGSFVQGAVTNAGQRVDSAVIGDVNGDGKLDLVAVGPGPCTAYGYYGGCNDVTRTRQASVLLGDGQGAISLPIASSLGVVNSSYRTLHDLALADLTGDGRLDLVTIDGGPPAAVIVAANNGQWNTPGELSIADVTVVEGNSGSVNAVFTVTRTGDLGGSVTVDFVVFDNYYSGALGIAQAGVDYIAQSGKLTFAPGILSRTITVPILGDRLGEGNETFLVHLSNPTGALLRDAEAVGTIADNEPTLSINHAFGIDPLTIVEGDSGTKPAVFTVTLSQPYDQEVTVDFYTLTGHTSDIISTSGTLRFLAGQTSKTITVQVVGDLLDEDLEAFNVYLTNPSTNSSIAAGAGYCFIEDNDPTPSVSINDVSKSEGNSGTTKFTFTLSLSAPSGRAVAVEYATADGTATTANQDYVAKTGHVAYFDIGATTTTLSIDVKGDTTVEPNETFFVDLVSASNATIADGQGVGTIVNDDGGSSSPSITISDASVVEGNSGTKLMNFTVSLSQASSKEVKMNYATANGTAKTSDNDYVAKSGTLTFSPGETTKTISVTIKGDTKKENDENFYVKLSKAIGGTITDSQGVGTIVNDDGGSSSPSITISDASVVEGISGTKLMTFTVSLSQPSSKQVKVNYATANGTAKSSDNDYVSKLGTLAFSPGQTTKAISVTIKGDTKKENDENFFVKLSNAIGGTITGSQGVGTILNDDGVSAPSKIFSFASVDAALDDSLTPAKKKGRK